MTEHSPDAASRGDWWVRPRVVLPIVGALLVVLAFLTPQIGDGRAGDSRLSAHLAGPLGARGIAELSARLGWQVVLRDSTPVPTGIADRTVYAVLDPTLDVSPAQAHRYLEAVRAGAGLLLVLGDDDPLADSLGAAHSRAGGVLRVQAADSTGCGQRGRDLTPMLWPDRQVHLYALRWRRGRPADAVTFASVRIGPREGERLTEETVAGFSYGRGRIVVVADPDLLRNDVIRRCEWGADVVAVRVLEWLAAGSHHPRGVLEFDEYHHGFGPKASALAFTRRFLTTHPLGRTILQLALAALVLLAAVAPRPIPPHPRPRAERRDPLEQVDALAHAYQQVGATRTATLRLLHGVRGRVEHAAGTGRTRNDDEFLARVAANDPERTDDVRLVRETLRTAEVATPLPVIGAALQRIEASITSDQSVRA